MDSSPYTSLPATAMLQPLAADVDPVSLASVSDNVLDGYRAVAPHLAARPGSAVLIVSQACGVCER